MTGPGHDKLSRATLLRKLRRLVNSMDTEGAHLDADALLIEYIDDATIAAIYSRIPKWYS